MHGLLTISSHCAVGVNAITRVPGLGPTSCCGTSSPTQDLLNIVRDRSLAGRVPMCPPSRSCQCYAPQDTPLSTARLRRCCWQAWHYLRVIAKEQGAAVACGHPRMLLYTGCTRPSVKPFALALARTSGVARRTPSRRRMSVQGRQDCGWWKQPTPWILVVCSVVLYHAFKLPTAFSPHSNQRLLASI